MMKDYSKLSVIGSFLDSGSSDLQVGRLAPGSYFTMGKSPNLYKLIRFMEPIIDIEYLDTTYYLVLDVYKMKEYLMRGYKWVNKKELTKEEELKIIPFIV